jgi:hypothetical protein
MDSEKPSHKPVLTFIALCLLVSAIAILTRAAQPSSALTLDRHWRVFGKYAALAALLLVGVSLLVDRKYRIATGLISILILSVAALMHPVCILIPETDRPGFETVIPLEKRAAQGEPFCRLGGEWYQCKSFIARAFFY